MILTKDYPALESRYECDVCSEAIINPICPFCITTEIEAWLTLYPDLKRELLYRIKKYLQKINNQITSYGTQCIKCRNKRAVVCPYCFTEYIYRELKKINASRLVLKEFFEFFNFDLHHTGYAKDAEKIGVI